VKGRLGAVLRNVVTATALVLVYAAAPVPRGSRVTAGGVLLVVAGAVVLAAVVGAMVRKERTARAGQGSGVALEALVLVVYATIAFFALVYLGVAREPGQFTGLETRIDALYFTTSTLTTVGYGDVAPVGQLARTAVTVQMLFNVLFVAVAARLAGSIVERRSTKGPLPEPASARTPSRPEGM
jgi:voltage-gated potassium channel